MADLIERDALGVSLFPLGKKDAADIYRLIMDAPAVNRWIPVEDALPCGGKRVLVTTAEGNVVDAIFVLKGSQWFRNGEYFTTDRVTAWMPMPDAYEPPEKE